MEYGGECVTYAGMTYFEKGFNVNVAAEVYNASTVRKLSGPKLQCIAAGQVVQMMLVMLE